MAFVTSKITACVYAFCAAEMAEELIRNQSEKLPVEGACPRLWCRPTLINGKINGGRKKGLTAELLQVLDFISAPGRNRTHDQELRSLFKYSFSTT